MYTVPQEAERLFRESYRQVLEIKMTGTQMSMPITEQDVVSGGMCINRYCFSGNRIEIGSAIAAELTLQLDNADGRFDDVSFEGAELFVRVGVKKWDARRWENANLYYVPMGYFTVDEVPRKLASIDLTALDRMVLFDKTVDGSLLAFPTTVDALLSRICDICNVPLGINVGELLNHDYEIAAMPEEDGLTYRQLLAWIAEITGTCAYIDWDGRLVLSWYSMTDTTIEACDRFTSDLQENSITISGVQVLDGDSVYLAGDDGYAINIESNGLVQAEHMAIAESLYGVLGGFSYIPFTATVKPMPNLYPLDIITFVDKNGIPRQTIITDITFTLNTSTSLQGKGETATKNGYASANPLTKREAAIINAIRNGQNDTLNDRIQSVLAFNELISNALGLYVTPVTQSNGSTIYYMHDQPNLEESNTIFTMTAGGIAWTANGWNGGDPIWSYGATAAGDALFRMLSAEGIEVSRAGEDYSVEITPKAFNIYYRDMLVTEIVADEMTIPKTVFTVYAQCGRIRYAPYAPNGIVKGTNLIFLD